MDFVPRRRFVPNTHWTIRSLDVSFSGVPSDTAAVSLVSFDRGTAAVAVAQTELQATDTAAVARVTATCDTAAVRLAGALATRRRGIVHVFSLFTPPKPHVSTLSR